MNLREWLYRKRRLFLLFAQAIIIVVSIFYANYVYEAQILPDITVSDTYDVAQCLVENEKIVEKGTLLHSYRADFLVSYSVEDEPYRTWVSGNGLDTSFTTDRASQRAVLDQFEVGQTYPCWYDPEAPEVVVLVLRHDWAATFPWFVPFVVLLIVIYGFLQQLIQFFRKTPNDEL